MLVQFTGRPVTAFAATVLALQGNILPQVETLALVTSHGDEIPFQTSASGVTFIGFTSPVPIAWIGIAHYTTSGNTRSIYIDNVQIGTSVTAVVLSDKCADAQTISPTGAISIPFSTAAAQGATADPIGNVCDGATDTGPDVWVRYQAPAHGVATFATCGCTFDSILRVFAACPSSGGEGQVACNDDACAGGGVGQNRGSQVSFRVVAGEDYWVRVSGYNGGSGSGDLSYSFVADCAPDYNHSGGIEVQDIFDFLNGWFAGCP